MHSDQAGKAKRVEGSGQMLWAVGGGKGGVGKTVLSSSLAASIASAGETCVVIDADFGAANLHTLLGVPRPQRTLSHFINGEVKSLQDILAPTPIRNLSIVSGSRALLEMANLKHAHKLKLIRHVQKLDVDHVLIDLGAGSAFNVLDFFVEAQRALVVVVPEPTSIENAYHFLRAAFYRALRGVAKRPEARDALRKVLDGRSAKPIRSARDLILRVKEIDPIAGKLLEERAAGFTPKLIVNQATTPEHRRVGWDVSAASREHLGINLGYLGAIDLDPHVPDAIARHQPVMQLFPGCRFAKRVDAIAHRLLRDSDDPSRPAEDGKRRAERDTEDLVNWGLGNEKSKRRPARRPGMARLVGAPASQAANAPRRERRPTLPPLDTERPGLYLKRCRELSGLSLQELTERTRIRGLERIEGQRFDELPPPPHLSNFVLQYARVLGIREVEELVDAYITLYHRTLAKAELA